MCSNLLTLAHFEVFEVFVVRSFDSFARHSASIRITALPPGAANNGFELNRQALRSFQLAR